MFLPQRGEFSILIGQKVLIIIGQLREHFVTREVFQLREVFRTEELF